MKLSQCKFKLPVRMSMDASGTPVQSVNVADTLPLLQLWLAKSV